MKFKSLFLLFTCTLSVNAFAADFLTIDDIAKSSLTDPEKGLASMTLGTDPVIECLSPIEIAGGEYERINIYRLDMGLSVAIWKSYSKLRVAVNEQNVADLTSRLSEGGVEQFLTASEESKQNLTLTYGHKIPMIGRVTDAVFSEPDYKTNLTCQLPK